MLYSLPNPTKKVTVNFPIDQVKQAIKDYPYLQTKYKITEAHDAMGFYILDAMEFISLGVFIDINLAEISPDKTEISIEIRRKVGTFNQPYEVSKAGTHINTLLTGLGELLSTPNKGAELKTFAESFQGKKAAGAKAMKGCLKGFLIALALIALFAMLMAA